MPAVVIDKYLRPSNKPSLSAPEQQPLSSLAMKTCPIQTHSFIRGLGCRFVFLLPVFQNSLMRFQKKKVQVLKALCHPMLIKFMITVDYKSWVLWGDRTCLGLRMGEITCLLEKLSGFSTGKLSKAPGKSWGMRNSTWVQEKDLSEDLFTYLGLRLWMRRSSVYYRRTNLENKGLPSASFSARPTGKKKQSPKPAHSTSQFQSSEVLWPSLPHLIFIQIYAKIEVAMHEFTKLLSLPFKISCSYVRVQFLEFNSVLLFYGQAGYKASGSLAIFCLDRQRHILHCHF